MTVAFKLRLVLAAHVALIAAVLALHVGASHDARQLSRALTAVSSRQQRIIAETHRVADMRNAVDKFVVTRDRRYLMRLDAIVNAQRDERRHLASTVVSADERTAARGLATAWAALDRELASARASSGTSAAVSPIPVEKLRRALDAVQAANEQLAAAARRAASAALAQSERAAGNAEGASVFLAAAAIILAALLSAHLVRSIIRSLGELTRGTRAIASGRLDHRIALPSDDEFAAVARDFDAMARQLGHLDHMKRDFVSHVSHDLKTPLSSMQETSMALLDGLAGPLNDRQRHLLSLNQENGQRLSSMVGKLLDLSRLDSQRSLSRTRVDIVQVARDIVERANAARTAGSARRPATLCDAGQSLMYECDEFALERLLDNLVENAVKFSPADGVIRVTVLESKSALILRVADQGPGVPDAEKERIFERFYQTTAGRAARAGGAGLGLAISKGVVDAHGGRIRILDNPGGGAVFEVTLPLAKHARWSATAPEFADVAGAAA